MGKQKKFRGIITVICMMMLMITSNVNVFASDDNISYSLSLPVGSGNAYTSKRYRQTESILNKWKVNYVSSTNSNIYHVNFWLAKSSDSSIVSSINEVYRGSGEKKYMAKSAANQTYVKLGAENASYDLHESGIIKGFWDEETW